MKRPVNTTSVAPEIQHSTSLHGVTITSGIQKWETVPWTGKRVCDWLSKAFYRTLTRWSNVLITLLLVAQGGSVIAISLEEIAEFHILFGNCVLPTRQSSLTYN